LAIAQGLPLQDEDEDDEEVGVDKDYYDNCNAYDEIMMIDSIA